jgi:hypothetical protein
MKHSLSRIINKYGLTAKKSLILPLKITKKREWMQKIQKNSHSVELVGDDKFIILPASDFVEKNYNQFGQYEGYYIVLEELKFSVKAKTIKGAFKKAIKLGISSRILHYIRKK